MIISTNEGKLTRELLMFVFLNFEENPVHKMARGAWDFSAGFATHYLFVSLPILCRNGLL